jgi:hypothetical protein
VNWFFHNLATVVRLLPKPHGRHDFTQCLWFQLFPCTQHYLPDIRAIFQFATHEWPPLSKVSCAAIVTRATSAPWMRCREPLTFTSLLDLATRCIQLFGFLVSSPQGLEIGFGYSTERGVLLRQLSCHSACHGGTRILKDA